MVEDVKSTYSWDWEKELTEDSGKVGRSQPRLAHHGTCALKIERILETAREAKPDKVADGDDIGEGLAQLVTGLLLHEEVAGVEDELEGGAAGLVLPPAAQDSGRQPVVLVHNPGDNDEEYFRNVTLNT